MPFYFEHPVGSTDPAEVQVKYGDGSSDVTFTGVGAEVNTAFGECVEANNSPITTLALPGTIFSSTGAGYFRDPTVSTFPAGQTAILFAAEGLDPVGRDTVMFGLTSTTRTRLVLLDTGAIRVVVTDGVTSTQVYDHTTAVVHTAKANIVLRVVISGGVVNVELNVGGTDISMPAGIDAATDILGGRMGLLGPTGPEDPSVCYLGEFGSVIFQHGATAGDISTVAEVTAAANIATLGGNHVINNATDTAADLNANGLGVFEIVPAGSAPFSEV